jgi:hypothetical protein
MFEILLMSIISKTKYQVADEEISEHTFLLLTHYYITWVTAGY